MRTVAYQMSGNNMRTIRNAKVAAKRKISEVESKISEDDSSSSSSDDGSSSDEYSSSSSDDELFIKHEYKRPKDNKRNCKSSDKDNIENNGKADNVYYVECIKDTKVENQTRYFYVKWLGWPESESSWEPVENMEGCTEMITDFLRSIEKTKRLNGTINGRYLNDQKLVNNAKQNPVENRKEQILTETRKISIPKQARNGNGRISNQSAIQNHRLTKQETQIVKEQRNNQIKVSRSKADTPKILTNGEAIRKDQPSKCTPINPVTLASTAAIQEDPSIGTTAKKHSGISYLFQIWMEEKRQVEYYNLDLTEKGCKDELFRVVLTEDMGGKDPKWFYGATEAEDGSKYCLVQFEGSDIVEVVSPVILWARFPYAKRFYDFLEKQKI